MLRVISPYTYGDIANAVKDFLAKARSDPDFREFSRGIAGYPPSYLTLSRWVRSNVEYAPDPEDAELIRSPVYLMRQFQAGEPLELDCDDIALLTVALCRANGIEAYFVLLDVGGVEGYDHAVAEVKTPNGVLMIDNSSSLPSGWEEQYHKKWVIR